METATLSHETSQFFGPSPRKQRLTVYRGLQVKANICVAREAFFCHVHRIHTSEFDEGLKEPSLGIKERSYVIGMFVIIMSAEIC